MSVTKPQFERNTAHRNRKLADTIIPPSWWWLILLLS